MQMKWWMAPVGAMAAATLFILLTPIPPVISAVLAGVLTGLAFRWGAKREG